jgi:hypothetical protein
MKRSILLGAVLTMLAACGGAQVVDTKVRTITALHLVSAEREHTAYELARACQGATNVIQLPPGKYQVIATYDEAVVGVGKREAYIDATVQIDQAKAFRPGSNFRSDGPFVELEPAGEGNSQIRMKIVLTRRFVKDGKMFNQGIPLACRFEGGPITASVVDEKGRKYPGGGSETPLYRGDYAVMIEGGQECPELEWGEVKTWQAPVWRPYDRNRNPEAALATNSLPRLKARHPSIDMLVRCSRDAKKPLRFVWNINDCVPDGTCDETGGETFANCAQDCPCNRDNRCDRQRETFENCPSDCPRVVARPDPRDDGDRVPGGSIVVPVTTAPSGTYRVCGGTGPMGTVGRTLDLGAQGAVFECASRVQCIIRVGGTLRPLKPRERIQGQPFGNFQVDTCK